MHKHNREIFQIPVNDWDVSRVTDMSRLFQDYQEFDEPINGWDVSNVIDMSYMFSHLGNFNQPLDNWDTSKVVSMMSMFANASRFNHPLDSWNVSKVVNMSNMFDGALEFNQCLRWNAPRLSNALNMFNDTPSLNQPAECFSDSQLINDAYRRRINTSARPQVLSKLKPNSSNEDIKRFIEEAPINKPSIPDYCTVFVAYRHMNTANFGSLRLDFPNSENELRYLIRLCLIRPFTLTHLLNHTYSIMKGRGGGIGVYIAVMNALISQIQYILRQPNKYKDIEELVKPEVTKTPSPTNTTTPEKPQFKLTKVISEEYTNWANYIRSLISDDEFNTFIANNPRLLGENPNKIDLLRYLLVRITVAICSRDKDISLYDFGFSQRDIIATIYNYIPPSDSEYDDDDDIRRGDILNKDIMNYYRSSIIYLSQRLFNLTEAETKRIFKTSEAVITFIWLIATCYDSKMNTCLLYTSDAADEGLV